MYLLKLIKKLETLILTFIYNSSTVSWHQSFRENVFFQERQSMTLSQNQIDSSFLNLLTAFLFSVLSAATWGLLYYWAAGSRWTGVSLRRLWKGKRHHPAVQSQFGSEMGQTSIPAMKANNAIKIVALYYQSGWGQGWRHQRPFY